MTPCPHISTRRAHGDTTSGGDGSGGGRGPSGGGAGGTGPHRDGPVFFDGNPTPFLTSAATQFDVELNRAIGMTPGSSHTFQVRAEDPSGNQAFSNKLTVSFAAGDNIPPTAPSNLRVVSNTASGVELAWDPSTDQSDFDYRVAGAPCSPLVVSGGTTHVLVPSVEADPVCGLVPGSTATFSVWARDALGNDSGFSNSVTVTT